MARIFISHSRKDKELVYAYVNLLQEYGHEIVIDDYVLQGGKDMRQSLLDALLSADGTVVFITQNGVASRHVNSEIGVAFSQMEKGKFLIPLVDGDVEVPYVISNLARVQLQGRDRKGVVVEVQEIIGRQALQPDPTLPVPSSFSPADFAKAFFNFLMNDVSDLLFGTWRFSGHTIYSKSPAPLDYTGFHFESPGAGFILKIGIRNEGYSNQKNDKPKQAGNFLALESKKFGVEVAFLSLEGSPEVETAPITFDNDKGEVSISDALEMTIDGKEFLRREVGAALRQAGFAGAVITKFQATKIDWYKVVTDILEWAVYREKAYLLLRDAGSSGQLDKTPLRNYWLLKIHGDDWNLPRIEKGDEGYFNSRFNSGEKRPDYEHFLAVKEGDEGLAYDDSLGKNFPFAFRVSKPLHEDDIRKEIFLFRIIHKPAVGIKLPNEPKWDSYKRIIEKQSQERLFPLTPADYFDAVELMNKGISLVPPLRTPRTLLSKVYADTPDKELKDQLGFTSDVNALAAVMAYREVIPPLAIGLFGKWGSGKSFFMKKLQQQIIELQKDKSNTFCQKVLQIEFNSWHYSDSNLWASLVSEIFYELNRFAKQENKEDELVRLQQTLNLAKMQKEVAEANGKKLQENVDELKKEKSDRRQKLEDLTGIGMLKLALSDKKLKGDAAVLLKNKNVEDIVDDANDLQKLLNEMRSLFNKLKASWELFKKARGWRWVIVILLAIGVFAATVLFTGVWKQPFEKVLAFAVALGSTFTAIAKYFWSYLKPVVQAMNEGADRLKSLVDTMQARPEETAPELDGQLRELKKAKEEIARLDVEIDTTYNQINEITSGARLFTFLEQRTADENYRKELGLISLIRKDFSRLDELLRMQFTSTAESISNPLNVQLRIDRIVLYIDDLDRCHESIVVRVLEAIHLLLAFPLFVVVVGVDPRWMHNALNTKYAQFLTGADGAKGDEPPVQGNNGVQRATSYDYLEKIFQIPFALKPMNATGKADLIKSQFQNLKKENEERQTKAKLESGTETHKSEEVPASESKETTATQLTAGQTAQTDPTPKPPIQPEKEIKKAEDEKEPPKEEAVKPESLQVSEEEIEFMQEISALIGDSPRTIKRYINIYRILRTHAQFETAPGAERDSYFAAMFLLAVITGLPHETETVFEALKSANEDDTLLTFLTRTEGEASHSRFSTLQPIWKKMRAPVQKGPLATLAKIRLSAFQKNIELACRFSFRGVGYDGLTTPAQSTVVGSTSLAPK